MRRFSGSETVTLSISAPLIFAPICDAAPRRTVMEDFSDLRRRLNRLGVHVQLSEPEATHVTAAHHSPPRVKVSSPVRTDSPLPFKPPGNSNVHASARKKLDHQSEVTELLSKIDRVEAAITTAEALNQVAQYQADANLQRKQEQAVEGGGANTTRVKSRKPPIPAPTKHTHISTAMAAAAARPHGGTHAVALAHGGQPHLRGPHANTPLSSVLAQVSPLSLPFSLVCLILSFLCSSRIQRQLGPRKRQG